MFNIEEELQAKGLDKETYEAILNDCEKKILRQSDLEWADIVDKYDLGIHYDSLRKNNSGIFGSVFVKEYFEQKYAKNDQNDEYLAKLNEKIRELERAKIKYRDERGAWQKQNYANSRLEETLSLLEESLIGLGRVNFAEHTTPCAQGFNEMIVMLSDLHIGQNFKSIFGAYNSDIAKERLNQYLNKVIEVAKRHDVKKVHVVGLGDLLSGAIHKSIAITNKENVIEQIKLATSYISSFCYELTKVFEIVQFYNVVGNHSRIDKKEDALHDERLDDIIGWAVSLSLSHIENFHYMQHRMLDSGIADLSVCGKFYLAVHGDMDPNTNQGIANLVMACGFMPEAILKGHMHSPAYKEFNGVKMIQGGSLAGSGDDYTLEKRLTGKPSQTLLICNIHGIECIYNVELD